MRIGINLGGDVPVAQHVQQVIDAEAAGFESAWFSNIFGTDPMTVIALAGARTAHIELGTAVVPTYLRHPFAMAQEAVTVQAATSGRFVLGIGLSHHVVVENMWGLSYEHPARHMEEYLKVLLPLAREHKVGHAGDLYRTTATLAVPDAAPLPVIVAALAPRMLRLAGELADGTVTWMTGVRTIAAHVAPKINAAAEAAGRPRPRVAVCLPVAVTEEIAATREACARIFQIYGRLPNYRRMLDKEGVEGPADVAILGDEAAVERQLRDLAAAGATDFIAGIVPAGADTAASIARTTALLTGLIGKT
ncbi:MAG TPA: TIGR03564 family F420-dependent LLM class oxidoreductase [Dehalococcoidia bacterium]|nr:TIGR03564 family F420-dependent LLM class oxidoreductase [Dehalococcoidia bacterium]